MAASPVEGARVTDELVRYSADRGMARIVLDSPHNRNALSAALVSQLGEGLVGACDIAVAGPSATFAFSEVRLGLAPAVISLTTSPRLTARAAGRYYLTGETFDAEVAARIG